MLIPLPHCFLHFNTPYHRGRRRESRLPSPLHSTPLHSNSPPPPPPPLAWVASTFHTNVSSQYARHLTMSFSIHLILPLAVMLPPPTELHSEVPLAAHFALQSHYLFFPITLSAPASAKSTIDISLLQSPSTLLHAIT
ncbi:hypothetical protein TcWFU_004235 [Taenia crassiceps]|uniref:Uncharacterized protein n=1 Tax=Taenia crassiceps TaxID=6207 RepID=A0ABR4Q7T3_9CEST